MLELNLICILTIASLISLDTTDASPLQGNPTAQHIQDVRRKSDDIHSLPSNHNLNLFLKKSELDKKKKKASGPHVHPGLTTKFIQMVAEDSGDGNNDDSNKDDSSTDGPPSDDTTNNGNDNKTDDKKDDKSDDKKDDKSDDKKDDKSDDKKDEKSTEKSNQSGNAGGSPEEITISLPKFQKDHMGNWIYHHWGATFGQVWGDTRFNNGRFTIPRIRVDSNAPNDYYPDGPRSTVCMGSTVYNVPRVKDWLRRNVYTEEHKHRPFWDNLRQIMFTQGNSEECHDADKYSDWKEYQECAMRRNQRLEYMVPKYPAHQIGYRGSHMKNPENN